MTFTNAGVGPAKIRSMRLIADSEPARDWAEAVGRQGGQLAGRVTS